MSNGSKVILGSLIGAGVAYLISQTLDRQVAQPNLIAAGLMEAPPPKESMKERWERAKSAGDQAKADKEAELRAKFRGHVQDPAAFADMRRADQLSGPIPFKSRTSS